MSDIFINSEISRPPRPGHGNKCNGHFTSIANGGKGHSVNDGCGCDGLNPETLIDFIAPLLLISAITIIYRKFKTLIYDLENYEINISKVTLRL